MLEKSGKWLKVSYEGKEGYMKAEHVKSLDLDLVAAYKHYAAVLEEELQPPYYTLLHDFTQDGLEELYFIYLSENREVRHTMLSGEEVLFDEVVGREGVTIYWDDYDYYLVAYVDESGGVHQLDPSDFGISSQHEYLIVRIGTEMVDIIRSGNLSLSKTKAQRDYQHAVAFETDEEQFDADVDLDTGWYGIDGKEVTEEEWKEVVSGYQNAPHSVSFSNDYKQGYDNEISNYEETIDQLYALYKKYGEETASTKELVDADQIAEIEWYTNFKNLQAHGGISIGNTSLNYLDEGEIDYISLLTMALSHPTHEAHDPSHYPRAQIDDWIYKNFGLRMDDEQVKEQIERYENAFLAEHESGYGMFYTEVHDDYYAQRTTADGIAWLWLELDYEPTIVDHYQLEDDFIALAYMELGPQKELNLMGTEPDYIIVKKVEAANGDRYYPYITTLQSLDQLDYGALNKYAENLDLVQEHKEVASTEESVDKDTEEAALKGSAGQTTRKAGNYALIMIGGLLLLVVVVGVNRKKSGGVINKWIVIPISLVAVILIGTGILLNMNASPSQVESDPSVDDDIQGKKNDTQEENEDDTAGTEVTDVSDEDEASSIKDHESSEVDEEKVIYIESVQYAEQLFNDANASHDLVDSQWDAYRAWDDELNKIYGLLNDKLSTEDMEALRGEQRAWMKERDNEANPEVVSSFQEVETLNKIVRERTLYLIDLYFDGE